MKGTNATHVAFRGSARWLTLLVILGLTASWFALTAEVGGSSAEASHFRSTQLTWEVVERHDDGRVAVEFASTFAARRGYGSYGNPDVGDTVAEPTIDFGDGATTQPDHVVTAVDAANDWFIAEWQGTHTYDEAGQYTAYWDLCCRLGASDGHVNNANADNRIQAFLDLDEADAGPVSTISPIVDCPTDGLCQFQVPGFDSEGMNLSWRMATGAEATGSNFTQPTSDQAAAVDGGTGLYTWDTTGADLASGHPPSYYSTQVVIEKYDSDGALVASSGVDFFIRLGVSDDNAPPAFTAPTPSDGSTLYGAVGAELSFDVAADDPDDGDVVSLTLLGKPGDAGFDTASGNPASGAFTWTPTATGSKFLVLNAQDDSGLGATQRTVTLLVGTIADIDLEPETADLTVGETHEVTATVVDGSGDPVEDVEVAFQIASGPNAGEAGTADTDPDGQATYAYSSEFAGTDEVIAEVTDPSSEHTLTSGAVTATWLPEPGSLNLAPNSATAAIGDGHEVTATRVDDDGDPVADVEISFEVTDGPHQGTTGTATTDGDGQASFIYEGEDDGTDSIVATHSPDEGDAVTSNTVTVDWTEVLSDTEEGDDPDEEDDVEVLDEAEAAEPVEDEPDFTG